MEMRVVFVFFFDVLQIGVPGAEDKIDRDAEKRERSHVLVCVVEEHAKESLKKTLEHSDHARGDGVVVGGAPDLREAEQAAAHDHKAQHEHEREIVGERVALEMIHHLSEFASGQKGEE